MVSFGKGNVEFHGFRSRSKTVKSSRKFVEENDTAPCDEFGGAKEYFYEVAKW